MTGDLKFSIADESESGDNTVPSVSGAAPGQVGGAAVKQSFKMTGFTHAASYDNKGVRDATFYATGKLLALLKVAP